MNILQIQALAKVYRCEIETDHYAGFTDFAQLTVKRGEQSQQIGSLLSVSAMTRDELQRIFESMSGTSLRDWWTGGKPKEQIFYTVALYEESLPVHYVLPGDNRPRWFPGPFSDPGEASQEFQAVYGRDCIHLNNDAFYAMFPYPSEAGSEARR